VMGAGTGGTSATIGRYLRYRQYPTRLCVADVEHSAFFDCFSSQDRSHVCDRPSLIEGVGRPRCEPSFVPGVVDRMMKIPDAATIAAMNVLSRRLRRAVGGSTGTNFLALCRLASEMRKANQTGSLVTLICDSGERYRQTYYEPAWLKARGLDPAPFEVALSSFLDTGQPLALEFEDVTNPQNLRHPGA
jgi:cysteine synthase